MLDIMKALNSVGATCLITSEAISIGEERQVQPEEYCLRVLYFYRRLEQENVQSELSKMRSTQVDSTPRPYQIGPTGIVVYPEQGIFQT